MNANANDYGMFLRVHAGYDIQYGDYRNAGEILDTIKALGIADDIPFEDIQTTLTGYINASDAPSADHVHQIFNVFGDRAYDAVKTLDQNKFQDLVDHASPDTRKALLKDVRDFKHDEFLENQSANNVAPSGENISETELAAQNDTAQVRTSGRRSTSSTLTVVQRETAESTSTDDTSDIATSNTIALHEKDMTRRGLNYSGKIEGNTGNDTPTSMKFINISIDEISSLFNLYTQDSEQILIDMQDNRIVGNYYDRGLRTQGEAFEITLENDGSYTFHQNTLLRHGDSVNPLETLTFNLGVRATDGNGNTTDTTLKVTVIDEQSDIVAVNNVATDDVVNVSVDTSDESQQTADQNENNQDDGLVISGNEGLDDQVITSSGGVVVTIDGQRITVPTGGDDTITDISQMSLNDIVENITEPYGFHSYEALKLFPKLVEERLEEFSELDNLTVLKVLSCLVLSSDDSASANNLLSSLSDQRIEDINGTFETNEFISVLFENTIRYNPKSQYSEEKSEFISQLLTKLENGIDAENLQDLYESMRTSPESYYTGILESLSDVQVSLIQPGSSNFKSIFESITSNNGPSTVEISNEAGSVITSADNAMATLKTLVQNGEVNNLETYLNSLHPDTIESVTASNLKPVFREIYDADVGGQDLVDTFLELAQTFKDVISGDTLTSALQYLAQSDSRTVDAIDDFINIVGTESLETADGSNLSNILLSISNTNDAHLIKYARMFSEHIEEGDSSHYSIMTSLIRDQKYSKLHAFTDTFAPSVAEDLASGAENLFSQFRTLAITTRDKVIAETILDLVETFNGHMDGSALNRAFNIVTIVGDPASVLELANIIGREGLSLLPNPSHRNLSTYGINFGTVSGEPLPDDVVFDTAPSSSRRSTSTTLSVVARDNDSDTQTDVNANDYGMFMRVHAGYDVQYGDYKNAGEVMDTIRVLNIADDIPMEDVQITMATYVNAPNSQSANHVSLMLNVFGERAYDALIEMGQNKVDALLESASTETSEAIRAVMEEFAPVEDTPDSQAIQLNDTLVVVAESGDLGSLNIAINGLTADKLAQVTSHTVEELLESVLGDAVSVSQQVQAQALITILQTFAGHINGDTLGWVMHTLANNGSLDALDAFTDTLDAQAIADVSQTDLEYVFDNILTSEHDATTQQRADAALDIAQTFAGHINGDTLGWVMHTLANNGSLDALDAFTDTLDAQAIADVSQTDLEYVFDNILTSEHDATTQQRADAALDIAQTFAGHINGDTLGWVMHTLANNGSLDALDAFTDTLDAQAIASVSDGDLDHVFANVLQSHGLSIHHKSAALFNLLNTFDDGVNGETLQSIISNRGYSGDVLAKAIALMSNEDVTTLSDTDIYHALKFATESIQSVDSVQAIVTKVLTAYGQSLVVGNVLPDITVTLLENAGYEELLAVHGYVDATLTSDVPSGEPLPSAETWTADEILSQAMEGDSVDHKTIAETLGNMTSDEMAALDDSTKESLADNNIQLATQGDDKINNFSNETTVLYGDEGNDYLQNFRGDSYLVGGEGNDSLQNFNGSTVMDGGAGNDRMQNFNGDAQMQGGAGDDTMNNFRGDSYLNGGAGDDTLSNFNGNSHLNGGEGDDTLRSYRGDSTLEGGDGSDKLYGGKGTNIFVFNKGETGHDTIHNFKAAEGDKIDISDYLSDVDVNQSAIDDFVSIRSEGSHQVVSVRSEVGSEFTDIATVQMGRGSVNINDIIVTPTTGSDTDII